MNEEFATVKAQSHRGRRFSVPVAVVASAGVVALVAGGVAYASIPSATGTITGCYTKTTGDLRVINLAKGGTCTSSETKLAWSQTGPAGPDSVELTGNLNPGEGTNNASTKFAFIGQTFNALIHDSVTVIDIDGSVDVGASDSSEVSGELGVCTQLSNGGGGPVTEVAEVFPEFTPGKGEYIGQSVNAIVGGLTTGSVYTVGLCTADDSANLEFGLGSATFIYAESAQGLASSQTSGGLIKLGPMAARVRTSQLVQ